MADQPTLSSKETLILRLLVACGESYGLELVRASGGMLKRGTVYVTLDRMEDKGLIASRRDEPAERPSKRWYSATDLGARLVGDAGYKNRGGT